MIKLKMLVYTSKSLEPISDQLLQDILSKARINNTAHSLSGFLVERDGYFLQLLEGPEPELNTLFAKIRKDPRHFEVTIQGECEITHRLFETWSMGQVQITDQMGASEDFIELFNLARMGKVLDNPQGLFAMLKSFSKEAKSLSPT